jgi:hypothetical protein
VIIYYIIPFLHPNEKFSLFILLFHQTIMAQKGIEILPLEDYKLPPLGHAISGAVGSTIANLFIYPLDM